MGYGYPTGLVAANRAGDRLLVGPFLYIADAHQSETDTLLNYDPKYHLLLDMAPKGVCRPDAGLELPVRLDGMSGASIWQTYYEGLLSKAWTTNDAVVVAVQTGVDRGGTIIKGTRWWVVDKIIRDAYPELERPLSLITP